MRLTCSAIREEVEQRLDALLAEAERGAPSPPTNGSAIPWNTARHSPVPTAHREKPLVHSRHDRGGDANLPSHQRLHGARLLGAEPSREVVQFDSNRDASSRWGLQRSPHRQPISPHTPAAVVGRSGMPASHVRPIVDDNVSLERFVVSGDPMSILRHLLKHFLAHPATYGTNVRALVEGELKFVLQVWASSSTGPCLGPDGIPLPNVIEDNVFERLIRSEALRRREATKETASLSAPPGGDLGFFAAISEIASSVEDGGVAVAPSESVTPVRPSAPNAVAIPARPAGRRPAQATASPPAATLQSTDPAGVTFEVSTLRRQIRALEQSAQILAEQANTKSMELNDARGEITDLTEEVEQLNKALVSSHENVLDLQRKLSTLKADLDQQLLKVTNFRDEEEDKRRTTEQRLKEIRSELSQVYANWKAAQNQLAASQKELDKSVDDCEQLHNDLTETKAKLAKAVRVIARRNRTVSLMQELLTVRRDKYEMLQNCVRELEAFVGAGTLTEVYLATDPAWSSFLFYRLHRHVYHVSANASVLSVASLGALTADHPLFSGTSDGGAWAVSAFPVDLLYALALSNGGTLPVEKSSNGSNTTWVRVANVGGDASSVQDRGRTSQLSLAQQHQQRVGACHTLRWTNSPFQVCFEVTVKPPDISAAVTTNDGAAVPAADVATVTGLPDSVAGGSLPVTGDAAAADTPSAVGDTQIQGLLLLRTSSSTAPAVSKPIAHKAHPILCLESLLYLPHPAIAKKLNVPATVVANLHKSAVAVGDTLRAESLAAMLSPPYVWKSEDVDDVTKLRRSDVRLILYSLWKARYHEHIQLFASLSTSALESVGAAPVIAPLVKGTTAVKGSQNPGKGVAVGAAATERGADLDPTASSFASPRTIRPFIDFVYAFLSDRFPLDPSASAAIAAAAAQGAYAADPAAAAAGGALGHSRRKSSAADGSLPIASPFGSLRASQAPSAGAGLPSTAGNVVNAMYFQPLERESTCVKCAVGTDKVAYAFLQGSVKAPLGAAALADSKSRETGDSLVQLSTQAKEVLCALLHFSYEYKEVDADFRLFYLVAHQLIPEAVAINFLCMTEAIFRDCDATVVSATTARVKRANLSTMANTTAASPRAEVAAIPRAIQELTEELPVTKVEVRSLRSAADRTLGHDDASTSEDDERSITDSCSQAEGALQTFLVNRNQQQVSLSPVGNTTASARGFAPARRQSTWRTASSSAQGVHPSVAEQLRKSEALHRHGLISLHEFVAILERHCFASYQLVRATAQPLTDATEADHELDLLQSADTEPRLKPVSSTRKVGDGNSSSSSTPSSSDIDERNEEVIVRAYRKKAVRHHVLRQGAGDASTHTSALERVGYVPLTPIQAQRLKFALSLDQPSSVVRYPNLFRPDNGAARPSHFYDELLTMVIDHNLAVQEIIMDEVVLPSCLCRHKRAMDAEAKYKRRQREKFERKRLRIAAGDDSDDSSSSDNSSSSAPSDDDNDEAAAAKRRAARFSAVDGPQEDCDGDILVSQMVRHATRWIRSLGVVVVAPPPGATASVTENNGPRADETESAVELVARRFVLQLADACPKDNTSAQFVDAVVNLTDTSNPKRLTEQHRHGVDAELEHYHTLPLHHLAMKLRTVFVIFDCSRATEPGEAPFRFLRSPVASPRKGAVAAAETPTKMSPIAFRPPEKEMLRAFREEMNSACTECDQRITLQRALHNPVAGVLPKTYPAFLFSAAGDGGGGGGVGAGRKRGGAPVSSRVNRAATLQKSAESDVDRAGGADDSLALPTFRALYSDVTPVNVAETAALPAGKLLTVAAGKARKSTLSTSSRRKSITEAISALMDASTVKQGSSMAPVSLSLLQDSKAIPLELSIATMLKRQLCPKFPPQLLPSVGDLQQYHKALMSSLLQPIDEVTVAALRSAEDRKASTLTSHFRGTSQSPQQANASTDESTAAAIEGRRRTLSKATSFALYKAVTADDQKSYANSSAVASRSDTTDGTGLPIVRRRLGSIAMGMYANLT